MPASVSPISVTDTVESEARPPPLERFYIHCCRCLHLGRLPSPKHDSQTPPVSRRASRESSAASPWSSASTWTVPSPRSRSALGSPFSPRADDYYHAFEDDEDWREVPAPTLDLGLAHYLGEWTQESIEAEKLDAILKIQGYAWPVRKVVTSIRMTMRFEIDADGDVTFSSYVPGATTKFKCVDGAQFELSTLGARMVYDVHLSPDGALVMYLQTHRKGQPTTTATITQRYVYPLAPVALPLPLDLLAWTRMPLLAATARCPLRPSSRARGSAACPRSQVQRRRRSHLLSQRERRRDLRASPTTRRGLTSV